MKTKETDLQYIKEQAKVLLHLDPVEPKDIPFILIHPFLNQRYMVLDPQAKEVVDILEGDNIVKARKKFISIIDKAVSPSHIFMFVHKPYRPLMFKLVADHLSKEDYNDLLRNTWIDVENPNQDPNVSIPKWISYFKKADKKIIMSENDYEVYNNLTDEIVIYRGVGHGREPFGLSWTSNVKTAKWFANRFHNKDAYMFKAKCKKSDVFCYFNERGEDELVVNVKNIYDVERIDLHGDN